MIPNNSNHSKYQHITNDDTKENHNLDLVEGIIDIEEPIALTNELSSQSHPSTHYHNNNNSRNKNHNHNGFSLSSSSPSLNFYKSKLLLSLNERIEIMKSSSPRFQLFVNALHYNPIPDDVVYYRDVVLIQDSCIVKLAKFSLLTWMFLCTTHAFVRLSILDWEYDENYTLNDFYLYDFHSVMLDTVVFFVVGRLYSSDRKGVDHLVYVLPLMLGAVYPSLTNTWAFLRHSISMYEIICRWPVALFEYVVGVVALDLCIVYLHLRDAYRNQTLVAKTIELVTCLLLFLIPMVSDSSFHMHHWFAAWLLGMHANSPKWWSRTTQAFLWGMYINGIAVYGRDPILGCAYSYFTSTSAFCSFMSCNISDGDDETSGETHYQPYIAPDWHNCTSA